jgi:hypothetical protein
MARKIELATGKSKAPSWFNSPEALQWSILADEIARLPPDGALLAVEASGVTPDSARRVRTALLNRMRSQPMSSVRGPEILLIDDSVRGGVWVYRLPREQLALGNAARSLSPAKQAEIRARPID